MQGVSIQINTPVQEYCPFDGSMLSLRVDTQEAYSALVQELKKLGYVADRGYPKNLPCVTYLAIPSIARCLLCEHDEPEYPHSLIPGLFGNCKGCGKPLYRNYRLVNVWDNVEYLDRGVDGRPENKGFFQLHEEKPPPAPGMVSVHLKSDSLNWQDLTRVTL